MYRYPSLAERTPDCNAKKQATGLLVAGCWLLAAGGVHTARSRCEETAPVPKAQLEPGRAKRPGYPLPCELGMLAFAEGGGILQSPFAGDCPLPIEAVERITPAEWALPAKGWGASQCKDDFVTGIS